MSIEKNENYQKLVVKRNTQIAKVAVNVSKVVFSDIAGVIITIGYQHFFTQPQNQIQEQAQQQEQTQNQSITVNINGQEISYQSDDVIFLNNKISKLETKNTELEAKNTELETKNESLNDRLNSMSSKINGEMDNYKLIIDGIEKNINYTNSVVLCGEHLFIRDDVVAQINNNLTLNYQNKEIVIGNIWGNTYLLMETCPPYQTSDSQYYRQPDTFKMAGEIYTNGFSMQDYSFALFNLNEKYTLLNFTLGHIDDTTMIDGVFNIYLDDDLYQRIEISCEDLPQPFSIPLNNASKMKIVKVDEATPTYQAGEWYGFANIILQ